MHHATGQTRFVSLAEIILSNRREITLRIIREGGRGGTIVAIRPLVNRRETIVAIFTDVSSLVSERISKGGGESHRETPEHE